MIFSKDRMVRHKKIICSFIVFSLLILNSAYVYGNNESYELECYIKQAIETRNRVLISGEVELIESIYDMKTKFGVWAYEHEIKKMKYIHNWENKQGVKFTEITPIVKIRKIKVNGNQASCILICSTVYKYSYNNLQSVSNTCRIGTEHYLRLIKQDDMWMIAKEWYKDPFADSLNLDSIKADEYKEYISSQEKRNFSSLNDRRISAVDYSDKHCGIAGDEKYGFHYNKKYTNFNSLGGDCANFASQILYEGGSFKKNRKWNYNHGGATKAWVNADGFKNYMINSGRASIIASGSYKKVYKASYKLLPGDFVAYEKKGDIVHISVVTDADSRGYALVSCHNTDRNRVPWDLGWSDKNIKFWLVRVHY